MENEAFDRNFSECGFNGDFRRISGDITICPLTTSIDQNMSLYSNSTTPTSRAPPHVQIWLLYPPTIFVCVPMK
jgi:hypothetical protein